MFKKLLNFLVQVVAKFHNFILSLNDHFGVALTDKQLHFIVIGIIGLILLLIINPMFKKLSEKHNIMVISWIYVFTIMVVLTLMIEIGQDISGTGNMEFADIMAGLLGFIIISLVYIIGKKIIDKLKNKENK